MHDNPLITIATTSDTIQAHIIKSKLESEGIVCFIADEYTININPLYSNALGGVRVQIRQADLERAREILSLPLQAPQEPECLRCRSHKIKRSNLPRLFNALSFLGLGVFFPRWKSSWTCQSCRHVWHG